MKYLSLLVFLFAASLSAQEIPRGQTTMPGPALSPKEAIAKMKVPPGFRVELVAAEPDIVNPVAMAIDDKGRFWITESVEYPKKAAGPGKDRVKVLESTKGDGVYDKVTTVLEGLNIPSGIAVGHGGVWLANAPDLLFYPFTDWETPKLGKPEVIVTGFGRTDTHELPNSLTWGPDGYLYGLNGVFNFSSIKHKGKVFNFTCAMFRIDPKTKEFSIFCEGTSNPWGIAFNENGDAFVSACVIDHLWHLTETGYYHRQGGPYPPFTWKIGSIVKHKHQKAAYCGLTWFDSDAYPEEYRGKLYMGNIHGNCINSDELVRDGSTYQGKPRPDFLTANDPWFMPVVQKVGPDGCLYILDWYDRYHCYQDANRDPAGIDRLKGRLYRVVYKDYKPAGKFDLTKESDEKLLELLGSPNIYYREIAQRLLVEHSQAVEARAGFGDSVLSLNKLMVDDNVSRTKRLHALWTNGSIQQIFWEDISKFKDPVMRAWGVRAYQRCCSWVVPDGKFDNSFKALAKDPSPVVLLQVAIQAPKFKDANKFDQGNPDDGYNSLPVLAEVLANAGDDKLIPHIVWQNLHPLLEERGDEFLKLVATTKLGDAPVMEQFLPRVIDRILGASKPNPDAVASLVAMLSEGKNAKPKSAASCIAMLAAKVQSGELAGAKLKTLQTKLQPTLAKLIDKEDAPGIEAAMFLASVNDSAGLDAARKYASQPRHGVDLRVRALAALIAAKDPSAENLMMMALSSYGSGGAKTLEYRGQVLTVLGKLDAPVVANVVLSEYSRMEPELQPKAIDLLTQRVAWSKRLVAEVQAKKIPASALNVNQLRKLLTMKDAELVKSVTAVWGTIREGRNPQREQLVDSMREMLHKTPGDAHKGVLVFKKLCAQCHKFHGEGAEVGPDLTGNGRSTFDQLVSNVFDPSLVIGAGYQATIVATKKGQIVTGLLVEDNEQRVILKTQGGKIETIARTEIDEVLRGKLSYMPEDVEKQLKSQEIADLFAYLALDKPPTDKTAKKIAGSPK